MYFLFFFFLFLFFFVIFLVYFLFFTLPHHKVWFTLVLHAHVAQSVGVFIGSAAPSVQTAVFLAPISSVPMMLFCGFFIVLDSIKPWLRWLQYFSYFRYSFVALVMAVFDDVAFDCGSLGAVTGDPSACTVCAVNPRTNTTQRVVPFANGNDLLFGVHGANTGMLSLSNNFNKWGYQILMLFIYFVILRIGAYLVLRTKGKRVY